MAGWKLMEEVQKIWHQDTTRDFSVFILEFMKMQAD